MYTSVIYGIGTSRWLKIETKYSIMDIGRDYLYFTQVNNINEKEIVK